MESENLRQQQLQQQLNHLNRLLQLLLQVKRLLLLQHQLVFIFFYFLLFVDMKCFLCQFEADASILKGHYLNYHLIDPNEENFLNVFKPNYLEDYNCAECQLRFSNEYRKKGICF